MLLIIHGQLLSSFIYHLILVSLPNLVDEQVTREPNCSSEGGVFSVMCGFCMIVVLTRHLDSQSLTLAQLSCTFAMICTFGITSC
jgi:hypothetical protein